MENLQKLSRTELRKIAKSRGIKGYSSLNKSQLLPILMGKQDIGEQKVKTTPKAVKKTNTAKTTKKPKVKANPIDKSKTLIIDAKKSMDDKRDGYIAELEQLGRIQGNKIAINKEDMGYLESNKYSNFMGSLYKKARAYGKLTINQYVYLWDNLKRINQVRQVQKDTQDFEMPIEGKSEGDLITFKCKIAEIKAINWTTSERHFERYRSVEHSGILIIAVCGLYKITFFGGSQRVYHSGIKSGDVCEIKAKIKKIDNYDLKINYVKDIQITN